MPVSWWQEAPGLAHCLSLKPTQGRTLPSFADAPVPLWQRCPVVVFGCRFLLKGLSVSCSGWWCPAQGKLYLGEGTVTSSGCRGSSTGLPGAVAHVRQVTVSCPSPLLAWLFLFLGQEGNSVPWILSVLLFSCLLEVALTLLPIATLQFHTFWKSFLQEQNNFF